MTLTTKFLDTICANITLIVIMMLVYRATVYENLSFRFDSIREKRYFELKNHMYAEKYLPEKVLKNTGNKRNFYSR